MWADAFAWSAGLWYYSLVSHWCWLTQLYNNKYSRTEQNIKHSKKCGQTAAAMVCPFLGSPVPERWSCWSESSRASLRWLRDWLCWSLALCAHVLHLKLLFIRSHYSCKPPWFILCSAFAQRQVQICLMMLEELPAHLWVINFTFSI